MAEGGVEFPGSTRSRRDPHPTWPYLLELRGIQAGHEVEALGAAAGA